MPKNIIKRLTDNTSLLDIMIQAEDYLDSLDLYAFRNWIKGEVVDGPWVKRYWVSFTLKYPYEDMPDPQGGLRLLKYGSKVLFKKTTEEVSVDPKSKEDIDPETKKPKTESRKIWYVTIKIPRRFIEDIDAKNLELYNDILDLEDVSDARDEGISSETGVKEEPEAPAEEGEELEL